MFSDLIYDSQRYRKLNPRLKANWLPVKLAASGRLTKTAFAVNCNEAVALLAGNMLHWSFLCQCQSFY